MISHPSPNHGARRLPVSILVLHYTGMVDVGDALARLCDPEAGVSAHYLIGEDGTVWQLVAEDRRAWHAGAGRWRDCSDVNSASIGIELHNPGHEWGYRPFPAAQMAALVPLVADITARHGIAPANVIAHADLAPARKQDPGELFDWRMLARHGLALAAPDLLPPDPRWSDRDFARRMADFGYDVSNLPAATAAFQRHFCQHKVDGVIDGEIRATLHGLQLDMEARGKTR